MVTCVSLKEQVLEIIERHRGKPHAIKGMAIAKLCGLRDDRAIQQAIEDLINEDQPIASSCSNNKSTGARMGYYIPETYEEEQDYKHQLRSRAIGNFHRYKSFQRGCARKHQQANGQARLI